MLTFGVFNDLFLKFVHLVIEEFLLSVFPVLVSLGNLLVHICLNENLSGLKLLFNLEFLLLFLLDRGLNLLHFLISMLRSVLFDGNLLFFSNGSSPEFDFSKLLLFVFFNLLSLLSENILVEVNNNDIVNSVIVLLKVLDSELSNLLESLNGEDVDDLESSLLSLLFEILKQGISGSSLIVSNFLLFLISGLSGSLELLLSLLLKFVFLSLVSQLLLDGKHLLFLSLKSIDLLIKLLFDLHEDSLSLSLTVGGGLNNFLESMLQLISK